MEKITFSDLHKNKDWKKAVIVITNDSFLQEYPLENRSYRISRATSKYFRPDAISNSIWGSSIDGLDVGVRLDWYLWGNEFNWKVEYCYIEE